MGGVGGGVVRGGGDGWLELLQSDFTDKPIRINTWLSTPCQMSRAALTGGGDGIDRGWGDEVKLSGCQSHYIILQNQISGNDHSTQIMLTLNHSN